MLRPGRATTTRFLAAAAYLLALAVGSLPHDHRHTADDAHGTADPGFAHAFAADHCAARAHDASSHDAVSDHAAANAGESPAPSHDGAPVVPDDECSICRLLSRPIVTVRPFEISDACDRVVPLAPPRVPDVQPVVVVVAQARAPPAPSSTA